MSISLSPYDGKFTDEQRKKMFGEALKAIREARGMTQAEIYNFLNIKATTYNAYEKGKANPSMETLVRLSFILDCTTDELLQKQNFIGDNQTQLNEAMKQFGELQELLNDQKVKDNPEMLEALIKISDLSETMNKALKKFVSNNNK